MQASIWPILCVSWAHAAQLRLVMSTKSMSVGQTISAELQLIDGSSRDIPELQVPSGLRAQFTGTSSSMTSVNFKTTRISSYNLGVTALSPGEWTLGPASVEVDGQVLTAPAVRVTVSPRSSEQAAQASVSGTLSDTSPYLGEVEVYSFEYRRAITTYGEELSPLSLDGFVKASEAEDGRSSYAVVEDGQRTVIDELAFPLVATQVGPHTVAPAMLTVRMADDKAPPRRTVFGSNRATRLETFSTEPIDVQIRPLPREGRPAGFSGLVGVFTAQAKPSGQEIPLGESITLTVRLRGDGRLAGFELPLMQSEDFQVYDDNPDYAAALVDGQYQASATYRRAIVPAQAGPLTLPPLEVSVFDPDAERYVTLRTDPVTINVLPGEEGAGEVTSFSEGVQRRDVEALGDDILPAPGDVRLRDHRLAAVLPWLLAAPSVPGLGLLGVLLWSRRPRPGVLAGLRQKLASMPEEPGERLLVLEEVFREAAGARLGLPGPAVTRDRLAELGASAVAIDEALSRARYGGAEAMDGLHAKVCAFVEGT